MLCADFKVRLRLWPDSFKQAQWMQTLPKDYAAYLAFYQLASKQSLGGMAAARAGWIELNNVRIWTQAFKPCQQEQLAAGTLIHLHGFYDHAASYPSLQRWALKNNLYYLTVDLPGHGLSSGKRASINSFADYQKLVISLVALLKENNLPRPWLLSGFSTGAAIALDYQLNRGDFDNTLLLAPLVRPVAWQPKLAPWLWLTARVVRRLPRKFRANSNDLDYLRFVQEQDCLQSQYLPLAWVIALAAWIKMIEQAQPKKIKALIIQGDTDTTVDWQYNLKVLNRLLPQATTTLIKEGAHQLLNEAAQQRSEVFECLDYWLAEIQEYKKAGEGCRVIPSSKSPSNSFIMGC